MKYFPKISRGNVYLSPLNPDDYELFTKWMNDSKITDWINNTKGVHSIESEKAFLESISKNQDPSLKALAIIKKAQD